MVNPQLDTLLQQVIAIRARVDVIERNAKEAGKALAALQRQIEMAMVKDMVTDGDHGVEGDHARTVTTL